MSVLLPRLQILEPIVDDKGRPTKPFQKRWAEAMAGIETPLNGFQAALDAITALQVQQDAFNTAIANLIITYDAAIVALQTRCTTIENRLTAAGIP